LKSASTAVVNKLKQSVEVQTTLRLIAEWNMNRYSPITSITNGPAASPTADADPDVFPIESIADPIRPSSSGIVKARASAAARKAIKTDGKTTAAYMANPNAPRYVTSSADSKYKYWQSPAESSGVVYAPGSQSIANVQPTIIYTNPTWSNKIVVGIENTYAWPTAWTVEITTDGTNWTTIATNPTIPTNGRVVLYRNSTGNWTTTADYDNPIQIRGVRINVTQMSAAKVYFSLIELGARLESDLSPYVADYSCQFEMSDYSFISPLGKANANTASVTLANFDNRFTNTNPATLYYGLIDKNVEMRMDVGISLDSYTTIPKTYEYIRQFTMITDVWDVQELDTITVPLQDSSQILQQLKPTARVFQGLTVAEIIWRILDSVGFTSYYVEPVDADPATVIPYYWTDGTKTVWDIITEITEATQTAAWFDEYGVMQIKTRTTAYNLANTPVWTMERSLNGTTLANLVSLKHSNDFEANHVTVNWYETDISKDTQGVIPMTQVWTPDGDFVLRSTQLTSSLTTTSQSIRIRPTDAPVWPYSGVIEIEGEFMRWTAKGYQYYNAAGVLQSKYISSNDEKVALDKLNPTKSFMNYFNGYLWIGSANRGLWSSVAKAHNIDATGYTGRVKTGAGTGFVWNNGWRQIPDLGRARITTNSTFKTNSWYVVSRGSELDSPLYYYGTRLMITNSGGYGAGMAMSLGSAGNEAGYYVELFQTANYARNPAARNSANELNFYVRYANGTIKRIGNDNGKGVPIAVSTNAWYDLDVQVSYGTGGSPTFNIFVNGILRMSVNVPTANMPATGNTGRWGVFTRGFTNADFEYLYGTSSNEAVVFDNSTLYDRIKKGYVSTQLTKEWTYNTRQTYRLSGKKKTYYNQRYNQLFVDEFGAGVHEVREMDVKFEQPVLHSRLYMSNDSQAICPDYTGTAFGAKFLVANTHRYNAILNGTDAVTFGTDNPVEQKMLIYGRTINVADAAKRVEVKDDAAIRRRGEVALEIDSPYIQNEASAKALGDWITLHWSGGMDELEIESFMNPLVQLGDVVAINYSPANMTANTHKYFIVGLNHSYGEGGLETTMTLRRAKI
jgi:hypothetical protein